LPERQPNPCGGVKVSASWTIADESLREVNHEDCWGCIVLPADLDFCDGSGSGNPESSHDSADATRCGTSHTCGSSRHYHLFRWLSVAGKIHKYASFATLPLFATELALGQSIYNDPANADSRKGAHIAVGTGIIGIFGVNAVTGVWNMVEDRHNPKDNKLRLIRGLLMLTANVGFVATAATGPHGKEHGFPTPPSESDKALHRDLAIGSMAIGTVGYTIMLFAHH
jgi:hypothetical protein